MKVFSKVVFIIHTCFELFFGITNYLRGGSSGQTPEQIAAQSSQMSIAFRFMGAALTALGVLGLLVLLRIGTQSVAARYIALGFSVFHGLGALGSLYTSYPSFETYQQPLALGAVVLHGLLAVGFSIIAFKK